MKFYETCCLHNTISVSYLQGLHEHASFCRPFFSFLSLCFFPFFFASAYGERAFDGVVGQEGNSLASMHDSFHSN